MRAPSPLVALIDGARGEDRAVVFRERTLTYGDLRGESARLARAMRRRGIGRGDRVGIWLPNLPGWLVAAFACWRLGAIAFPLNPRLKAKELGDLLQRSGCRAVALLAAGENVSGRDILRAVPEEQRRSLALVVALDEPAEPVLPGVAQIGPRDAAAEEAGGFSDAGPEEGCLVFATSGTTRAPKLVLHRHGRVGRQLAHIAKDFALAAEAARMLLALPLSGAFGLTIALVALCARRPLFVQDKFAPEETAREMRDRAITHMLGTDDMLDKLLDAVPDEQAFPALRFYGHANYSPSLTDLPRRAQQRGVRMRGMYGMRELLAFFPAHPEAAPLERRALGGGLPACPEARVRVRLLDSGEIAPEGAEGEIEIRSPNLFVEYLGDAEATREAFTGDGGFVYLSRIKDVLRIGGYLVNPAEIEDVVAQADGIAACQVVAVPYARSVRPVACVLMKPGARLDEGVVIERCRSTIAIYKTPVRVIAMDSFPTTDGPNGAKVQKAVLRDMVVRLLECEADALGGAGGTGSHM